MSSAYISLLQAKCPSCSPDSETILFPSGRSIALGFWTTIIGDSSNELTYMLAWESLADRHTKWTKFQNDPAWHKARDDSERDGPIVASIRNQILTPTGFSALK